MDEIMNTVSENMKDAGYFSMQDEDIVKTMSRPMELVGEEDVVKNVPIYNNIVAEKQPSYVDEEDASMGGSYEESNEPTRSSISAFEGEQYASF
jgi:hypothetical protein